MKARPRDRSPQRRSTRHARPRGPARRREPGPRGDRGRSVPRNHLRSRSSYRTSRARLRSPADRHDRIAALLCSAMRCQRSSLSFARSPAAFTTGALRPRDDHPGGAELGRVADDVVDLVTLRQGVDEDQFGAEQTTRDGRLRSGRVPRRPTPDDRGVGLRARVRIEASTKRLARTEAVEPGRDSATPSCRKDALALREARAARTVTRASAVPGASTLPSPGAAEQLEVDGRPRTSSFCGTRMPREQRGDRRPPHGSVRARGPSG